LRERIQVNARLTVPHEIDRTHRQILQIQLATASRTSESIASLGASSQCDTVRRAGVTLIGRASRYRSPSQWIAFATATL
jgi:hypothetical protein